MNLNDRFHKVFGDTPIMGMIHLAGDEPVKRALNEVDIYEEEGIDGAIIENYHGSITDVVDTLQELHKRKNKIVFGVNVLPNEFDDAFLFAEQSGADFIQLDHVAGNCLGGELNVKAYSEFKEKYSDIMVLGGVWPKYYTPVPGSDLETDLKEGMKRAEAIVVTGEGTGIATPASKVEGFKEIIGNHPLIVGAGLTLDNAYKQLCLADGGIVGSYFKKNNDTRESLDRKKVKDFMDLVKEAREHKKERDLS